MSTRVGAEARPGPALRARQLAAEAPWLRHLGLPVAVALAAVLNLNHIAQNGYANIFYSAGDRSMLKSLHNFLFVSSDPGGLISIDKPPLGLWVQTTSAKVFGFHPLSLLLPEALMGIAAVAVLYVLLARRLGAAAAFAGALALAVFPSFVAVSRENAVDPLLILLMLLACGAALRACEKGGWLALLASGALVGLAFNTKMLAALLVVPGIAAGYLVCAPGSIRRRVLQLLAAGAVMVAVSAAWIAVVELTPASQRPYVGGSTDNTERSLAFEYNGFGRVEGQAGGPNTTVARPGARVPSRHPAPAGAHRTPASPSRYGQPPGREAPIPFGGPPGPLRLFGKGLGDQGAWLLPFAAIGMLALVLLALGFGRSAEGAEPERGPSRRDPKLASAIVLGGWFATEVVVLSASKGIVHPYYVSALGPATAAMVGAGAGALVALASGRRRVWALLLTVLAVAASVAVQVVLMHREHYMHWFIPLMLAGCGLAAIALLAHRRLAAPAVALALALLLIVPGAYASTTWLAPVEGTFPAAGPSHTIGVGGIGISRTHLATYEALVRYLRTHRPGTRWLLLTVASDTAAPVTLMGFSGGSLGGYSGTDPAIDGRGLARLVARGEARYVLLGGEYSTRGGNRATAAVLAGCRQLRPSAWNSPLPAPYGLTLFDCAGRERRLAAHG